MAVDLLLVWDVKHGKGFVGIDQVADGVVNDGSAGGVDECLDCVEAASTFEEVACPIDIDSVIERGIAGECGWGGSMYDDLGPNASKNFLDVGFHRDIGGMVFHRRDAVAVQLEIKHGDLSMDFKQLGDNVVSEESTAAYDQYRCIWQAGSHDEAVCSVECSVMDSEGGQKEVCNWFNWTLSCSAMCHDWGQP